MNMGNWKQSLFIAFRELIKIILLASIPLLISGLQMSGQVDWRAVGIAVSIAVLNAINEFIKEWNKVSTSGLLP